MNDSKRYDDETTAEILKRAAELQHEGVVSVPRGDGLTGSELEQVAREAGIDPAFVRRAITESDLSTPDTEHSRFLGEVKTLEIGEMLEGEVSPDSIDRMIEEVRRAFADGGNVTRTDRSATWSASRALASSRLSNLVVAITARDGQTEIRISERLDNLSSALFLGIFVAGSGMGVAVSGAIGMGELGAPVVFGAMAVAAVSTCYGTARTLYTRSTRKRRRELQRLLGRMVEVSISGTNLAAIPEQVDSQAGSDPSA